MLAVELQHIHRGAEDYLAVGQRPGVFIRHIDDVGVGELGLDVFDATLDEALLLAGRMVLGILLEIAVGARFSNGLDDPRPLDSFQALELGTQLFGAFGGQRCFMHGRRPLRRVGSAHLAPVQVERVDI